MPANEECLVKVLETEDKFNKKLLNVRMAYILNTVTADKIANLLICLFITVLFSKDKPEAVIHTNLSITLGKKLFNIVVRKSYIDYSTSANAEKDSGILGYNEWVSNTKSPIVKLFDVNKTNIDTYTSSCGKILIEQLIGHDMVYEYVDKHNKAYVLGINSDALNIIGNNKDNSIIPLPLHLPMVEEPKKHSYKTLGGYLLNDVEYRESLIIQSIWKILVK